MMAAAMPIDWQSPAFRASLMRMYERAMNEAGFRLTNQRAPGYMESQVFRRSTSKEEYMSYMAKLILHVKELGRKRKNQDGSQKRQAQPQQQQQGLAQPQQQQQGLAQPQQQQQQQGQAQQQQQQGQAKQQQQQGQAQQQQQGQAQQQQQGQPQQQQKQKCQPQQQKQSQAQQQQQVQAQQQKQSKAEQQQQGQAQQQQQGQEKPQHESKKEQQDELDSQMQQLSMTGGTTIILAGTAGRIVGQSRPCGPGSMAVGQVMPGVTGMAEDPGQGNQDCPCIRDMPRNLDNSCLTAQWLLMFDSSTIKEFYLKVKLIAKIHMSLDELPFALSDLEHPSENTCETDIVSFLSDCYNLSKGNTSDAQAKELIGFLKNNPPKESYKNPELPESSNEKERNFAQYIYQSGIDLPGSKHNLWGHLQNLSNFFIDMFFGNYTEFIEHLNSLSKAEMKKALLRREGYCQFSPIFAPIIGWKMVCLTSSRYTTTQIKKIREFYSGNNENMHYAILKKILKNRAASVNEYDITGSTPLHYALMYGTVEMVALLLKHGANPNKENRCYWRPFTCVVESTTHFRSKLNNIERMQAMDLLLQYKGKLTDKTDINLLRSEVEAYTFIQEGLVMRLREAHPRDKNECERCGKPAHAVCAVCSLVYYCTSACQKLDWKFHKVTCKKNKR